MVFKSGSVTPWSDDVDCRISRSQAASHARVRPEAGMPPHPAALKDATVNVGET
jgi:hypothetical protein